MKMKNFLKYIALVAIIAFCASSCEKFLDRPAEDSYTTANYYQNDLQVEQAVNYLYNSPWHDVRRFYIYGSETMCGNVYQSNNAYGTLTVNGTDEDLVYMAYSLWAVNSHCNTVINNILNSTGSASKAAKDKSIGEALAWKAMAYFMLVRTFGDIPIIHDNTEVIKEATYNEQSKVAKEDVYEYIIMTLEKAMELLPKDPNRQVQPYRLLCCRRSPLQGLSCKGRCHRYSQQRRPQEGQGLREGCDRQLWPQPYPQVFRRIPPAALAVPADRRESVLLALDFYSQPVDIGQRHPE